MAVASDLPRSRTGRSIKRAKNSVVYASRPARAGAAQLAKLTGNQNRILVGAGDISPNIKNAVIAIEDRRFYQHEGVDYQGIGRALCPGHPPAARRAGRLDDHPAVREERAHRPGRPDGVPEAPRGGAGVPPGAQVDEAEGAHPVPEQRLLRQRRLRRSRRRCGPTSAGTTAGHSPTGLDPRRDSRRRTTRRSAARRKDVSPPRRRCWRGSSPRPACTTRSQNPAGAKQRRNQVLERMLEQGMISKGEYADAIDRRPPHRERDRSARSPTPSQPYFTSWLTQQLVDRYRAPARVQRRAEGEDHAGSRAPGRRRAGDHGRLAGVGPQRVARGDREQDGRGEGDGGRHGLRAASPSTSRPTGTASPDRRSSRSRSSARSRTA